MHAIPFVVCLFFSVSQSTKHAFVYLSVQSPMNILDGTLWRWARWNAESTEFSAFDTSRVRIDEANKNHNNNKSTQLQTTTSIWMKTHTKQKQVRKSLASVIVSVSRTRTFNWTEYLSFAYTAAEIRKRKKEKVNKKLSILIDSHTFWDGNHKDEVFAWKPLCYSSIVKCDESISDDSLTQSVNKCK